MFVALFESPASAPAATPGGAVLALEVDGFAPYLLILGLLLVTASLMMKLAKRRRGGSSAEGSYRSDITASERLEKIRQEQGLRRDLDSLMVEIEEMAKRLSHQLDAKAQRLEQLIDDADHRLVRLKAIAERLERAEANEPDARVTEPDASAAAPASPPASAGNGPTESDLLAAAGGAATDRSDASESRDDPLTRSVYALADEGHDARAIAARLDEHTGKIELILALRSS